MVMKKILFLQVFMVMFFVFGISCTAGEMKGMWVTTVFNLDYPTKATTDSDELKREAEEIINNCEDMGINNIFLQVRPMSDAFYKSSIYPWSNYLTGSQGTAPDGDFDPLVYWIDECHKRGIKLHAWINPYKATRSNKADDSLYKNLANMNPAKQHPEYLIKYENDYYYDPALPEVRELVINGAMEIVNNYEIDGIHFDDYFYPGMDFDDSASFAKYGSDYDNKADWRRNNVNMLISTLSERIKETKPNVEFGISPCGIWANSSTTSLGSNTRGMESYTQLYADTRKWALENTIDYIAPQIYWNIGYDDTDYKTLVLWWTDTLKDSKTKLYVGMADYKAARAESGDVWYGTAEISRQLDLNDSMEKISGEIHYRYNSIITKDDLISLYKERYKTYAQAVNEPIKEPAEAQKEESKQMVTKNIKSIEGCNGMSFAAESGNIDVVFDDGEKTANILIDGAKVQITELDEIYTNIGSYATTVGSYELDAPIPLDVTVGVPEISDNEKYYVIGLEKKNTSHGKLLKSNYEPKGGKLEFLSDNTYSIIEIVKLTECNVLTLTIGKRETILNGEASELDAPAEIREDYTFVPVRYIGESLGVKVDWNKESETAIFTKEGKTASVTIGKPIDGYGEIKAYIKNSRTMVPARYIYETFGAYVLWEPNERVVTVIGK